MFLAEMMAREIRADRLRDARQSQLSRLIAEAPRRPARAGLRARLNNLRG